MGDKVRFAWAIFSASDSFYSTSRISDHFSFSTWNTPPRQTGGVVVCPFVAFSLLSEKLISFVFQGSVDSATRQSD
jgi:hypothetical protein